MISPEEKFKFDLEGYLMVRNALTPEEVVEMNRIADEIYTEDYDEKGFYAPGGAYRSGGHPFNRLSTIPQPRPIWLNSLDRNSVSIMITTFL